MNVLYTVKMTAWCPSSHHWQSNCSLFRLGQGPRRSFGCTNCLFTRTGTWVRAGSVEKSRKCCWFGQSSRRA